MKSSGFSRAERLRRPAIIHTVFRKGKKYSCDGAKLFVLPNGLEINRIVFTFPRGYGTAVERNHSRRLSSEVYRLNKLNLNTGYDLTVLVYPGKDTFDVRKKQLLTLFNRAGIWLDRP